MTDSGGASLSYAERLLASLALFSEGVEELGVKEIAERLDLSPSSAHRLLEPLVAAGLVERAPKRRYRMGTELFRLAMRIQNQFAVVQKAKPLIAQMHERSGDTCLMGLLTQPRTRVVLVHRVDSELSEPFRLDFLQNITPAWGSIGRAIMPWLSTADLSRIVAEAGPAPATGETLPRLSVLQQEFEQIRKHGYAFSQGQREAGARGISAPFFDASGNVRGALGIIAPQARISDERAVKLGALVKSQAGKLSRSLGYRRNAAKSARDAAGAAQSGDAGRFGAYHPFLGEGDFIDGRF